MKPISRVEDDILQTAWEVVNGSAESGTENIHVVPERYVETDEKGAMRYDSPLEVREIRPGEEFPRSIPLWARTKTEIEDELEERDLL